MMNNAPIDGTVASRGNEILSHYPNWQDSRRLYDKRSVRPRVLIVDDDPDFCEMIAQLLTGKGFDTDTASNGQDALDKAQDNPPRVIVLDMRMPVMDGWTFRTRQKYCVNLAAIPVIVLSAAPPARLRNIGAALALQKPVQSDELVAAVRALC